MNRLPGNVTLPADSAAGRPNACGIAIGTSGYSYTEWVDSGFYPPGTRTAGMLPLYARSFSVVELNYTWYQMAHLQFAAKLTRTMTHERDDGWREQLQLYRQGIAPLGDRLVAVLVQLPPDYDRGTENRRHLAQLLDGLHGLPVAVEFRHVSWAADPVFAELERRGVTLVTVDEPALPGLFPALDVVTNPALFYVRFHGRNSIGWQSSNMQKKFDYDYSLEELRQWHDTVLKKLAARADRGVIFFNNHVRAQAPRNAGLLAGLLGGQAAA